MKSKKYYTDLINHNKIIKESETLNSNGDINLNLWLSPTEHSSNKMTINELAIEMREGFKQINHRLDNVEKRLDNIEKRLDEHDVILREHSEIFTRNNLK